MKKKCFITLTAGLNRSFEDPAYAAYQDEHSSPSSNADQQVQIL
jgi:hypothetical protein